ncbi:MAG: 30S ribosomal protein S6 [Bacilli bacterium]
MNKYEIMFIVKADLGEEEGQKTAKDFEEILTSYKATIENSKDMGVQRLAYPIKDAVRGNYHVLNVTASAEAIKEFDRKALIDERILRHLIIKDGE